LAPDGLADVRRLLPPTHIGNYQDQGPAGAQGRLDGTFPDPGQGLLGH
jgi:hypothetical protein